MMRAIYAGSFDPVTEGHWDIIERARHRFDQLAVVVATNSKKSYMFSAEERRAMIVDSIPKSWDNVAVMINDGLTVSVAKAIGARVIIRGLRPHGDFETEYNLALINSGLAPDIETMFLIAKPELIAVSSSAVKELARYGQNINRYVSIDVADAIRKKLLTSAVE
jgi:pantetheine-phosphate adenylyltransferase